MGKEKVKGLIMVVDDDWLIRDILARVLRGEGYEVFTARNGSEALEETSRRAFDVVFLDIAMPGLSGLETLTRITTRDPDIPVVLLTALTDPAFEKVAMLRNATAVLTKPCSITEIIHMTNRLVRTKRRRLKNRMSDDGSRIRTGAG